MSARRLHQALLIAGLLAAFALRVHRLGDQNIWWDEGLAIWAVRHGFVETTLWTAGDVHPPLYFWLLWPWVRLVGETELAARYLTVLVGLLTVAAMAPLGRHLGGKAVGLGALWLLALSRFHAWWSQEMRMYALAALFATLSFYFLARAFFSRSRRDWAAWIGATAAALYTIYFSALLLLVQNLFALAAGARRKDRWSLWGRWLLGQVAVLALFAPWLALALPRMRSWSVVEEPAALGFVFQLNGVLLTTGISTYVERYAGIALAVGMVVLWGLIALVRYRAPAGRATLPDGLTLLLLGTVLPPVMVWLVTQPRAIFYTPRVEARYFLSFAPLFYVLLAWALAGLLAPRRLRPVGLVAGMAVLGIMLWALPGHYAGRYLRDDLQSMVRTIWAHARPGDAVVLVSGDRYPVFLYYYDWATALADRPPVYLIPRNSPVLEAAEVETELAPIVANHPRIWLAQVESHLQDPQGEVERWLQARYTRSLYATFGRQALFLFTLQPEEVTLSGTASPQYLLRAVAGGIEVLGYDLPVREFRLQDTVRLGLYLRPHPTAPSRDDCQRQAQVSAGPMVVMVGPTGEEVAAVALPSPPDGGIRYTAEFPVTACIPQGRYHFELRAPDGTAVPFGEIQVTHIRPSPTPTEIPHPASARVGETIRFLGYGLYRQWGPFRRAVAPGETVRPGDHLMLDLYWQAEGPVKANYTVFTHLVGTAHNPVTGGPVWAQDDHEPVDGLWLPGCLLRDRYKLVLPPDTPAGEYVLEVGMYLLATGERLPVSGDGADPQERRILLRTVRVEP